MARADLLLDLVRSGAKGEQMLFRKALEALISEERSKQHHILADRLAANLEINGASKLMPRGALTEQRFGTKGDLFFEVTPEKSLSDLVLPVTVRETCSELVEEQYRADLLRAHNLEPRHRVLLAGPPGNGKTSLAEALATELAIPLIVVRYESLIASYLGETAVRVARLFEQVRARRCVLFFDEFDVVGKERGDIHETGEIKRVVSSLLLQVDALPSYVVVVTATNHPELLDRAVWRRFQLRLELPLPSVSEAEEWFCRFEKRFGAKFGLAPGTIAKKLKGVSFSELEQFALDFQRRYVLEQSEANAKKIIQQRLRQWQQRFKVNSEKIEEENG